MFVVSFLAHSTSEDRLNAESTIEAKHQEYSLFEQHFSNLSAVRKVSGFSLMSINIFTLYFLERSS